MKDEIIALAFLAAIIIIGQLGDFGVWLAIALVFGILTYERK